VIIKILQSAIFVIGLVVSSTSYSEEPVVSSSMYDTICYKIVVRPTQEPSFVGPRCRLEGDMLYIDGAITFDMYYEIKYNTKIKRIELNSYGGMVEAGYEIAEIVRARGIETNVRKNAKCASACTLIFQAGVKRSAHQSVRFLYHGARLRDGWLDGWWYIRTEKGRQASVDYVSTQIAEVKAETEKLFSLYVKYGMTPDFIDSYKAMPIADDWFTDGNFSRTENLIISAKELTKFNVVQEFDTREDF
jgi:hypothetical protein